MALLKLGGVLLVGNLLLVGVGLIEGLLISWLVPGLDLRVAVLTSVLAMASTILLGILFMNLANTAQLAQSLTEHELGRGISQFDDDDALDHDLMKPGLDASRSRRSPRRHRQRA